MIAIRTLHYNAFVMLVCLMLADPANAETVKPRAKAMAELRLNEAVGYIDRGDFATACPMLEDVVKLVPDGIGGRQTLGECYKGLNRFGSAWFQYDYARLLAVAQSDPRITEIKEAIDTLAPQLPQLSTVTILVPDAMRNLRGFSIILDTVPLVHSTATTLVPVDQGTHIIEAQAPGYQSWNRTVRISANGKHEQVQIPVLTPAQVPMVPGPENAQQRNHTHYVTHSDAPTGRRQALGWGMLSVGILGFCVGGVVYGYAEVGGGSSLRLKDEISVMGITTMSASALLTVGGILLVVIPTKNKPELLSAYATPQLNLQLGLNSLGLHGTW